MEFTSVAEFDSELDKLLRKYRSLKKDLEVLKSILLKYPRGYDPVVVQIPGLGIETEIYKVKHFRCKALNRGSRSGIRVTYAYLEAKQEIKFVEIYYKEKDDVDCNKERIRKYFT
ncbi:MAG: hypothetical protein Q8O01_04335 [Candidatus Omnitrophota bacterium]|nr:hypothetical protein [Candidatus Omnitrophota bacterium]